jgi:hypothetical protein
MISKTLSKKMENKKSSKSNYPSKKVGGGNIMLRGEGE